MLISSKDSEELVYFDFLSSGEICVILQSDVLLMQNWDHVNSALNLLNR